MSTFKEGQKVKVVKDVCNGTSKLHLEGSYGIVRSSSEEGVMVLLDFMERPLFFYEEELEVVDIDSD